MTERDYKKDYEDLFQSDAVQRRERIAMAIFNRNGFWDERTASNMEEWMIEDSAKIKVSSVVSHGMAAPSAQPKRKYTKKSKRWKKKSAKKSA